MIVMNTLTGAVSEYSNYAFDSMTETKAGSATGLYAIGGDTDAGIAITGEIVTGKPLWSDQHKKHIEAVWLSMKGEGIAQLIVQGEGAESEWRYAFAVRPTGQSRALPGKGIRENYMAFGVSHDEPFRLDRIEVRELKSKTRRVG
jgi:hypothetical protein